MSAVIQEREVEPGRHRGDLEFRRLLERLPAAAYTCDAAGLITYFNERAVQLWGRAPRLNDPIDRFCGSFRLFSPDGRPIRHDDCWMARTLREDRPHDGQEIVIERPDGSRRTVTAHANPFHDDDGRLAGAVNVLVDITERKLFEGLLTERNRLTALRADVGVALTAPQPAATALQQCCEALVRRLDVAFARIWLLAAASDTLELQASAGLYTHRDGRHSRIRVGEFKIGRIARDRQPHLTNDVLHDPNISDPQWARKERMVAFAGYPLLVEGRCLGVVAMFARRPLSEAVLAELAPLAEAIAQYLDRKRVEEEVRRANQTLRALVQSCPLAVVVIDPDPPIVRLWNPAAERLFGWSEAEVLGRPIPVVPGEKLAESRAYRNAVRCGQTFFGEETYRCRRDGLRVDVGISAAPLCDAAGQVSGLLLLFADVTARRRAEEALHQSEQRLRRILDTMPQKVFTACPAGEMDYFNPQWMEFAGRPFERLRDWGWAQLLHPDDAGATLGAWRRAVVTGEPFQFQHRFRRADGLYRWHLSRAVAMRDADGRIVQWIGASTDIHDAKEAEEAAVRRSEQLRRLADVATRLNAALDISSILGVVTEEARALIGAHQAVASMTADQNWAQAIDSVSLSDKYAAWRDYNTRPDGSGIYSLVCRTNRPMRLTQAELEAHPAWGGFGREAGRHPPMRGWLAAPLFGRQGHNIGLVQLSDKYDGEFTEEDGAILVQLAQMASVAIENARLVESLREADRRKDEFLATLAHELRNPLAPLRNGLQVMRLAKEGGAAVERARAMMDRQLGQMVRLIDDLLNLSRITQGKIELCRGVVELVRVVQQAVETSRPVIEEARHSLALHLPAEPVFVDADVVRLAQVLSNLLNNAAKYTEPGGRISLTVERRGDEAVLRVRDNGVGIPPTMLPRVFDMFTRVDRSVERSQGGLGIGLSLVRGLVEMHGGRVTAHSDGPGRGSEFVVRLPIVPAPPPAPPTESDPGPTVTSAQRILVVDDNRDSAESLATMLRLIGHEAETAHDGLEAIAAAERYRPDVVLLDIGLPGVDGYEACRRIRRQPWGLAITLIAQTGWGSDDDRLRTAQAGFDAHLVKPIDYAALMELLHNGTLRAARRRREGPAP